MPWWHADPLTDALYEVRMRGAFYSWTEASAEGSVDMPQFPDTLSFHIVARGTAFLEVDGRDALPARRGGAGAGARAASAIGCRPRRARVCSAGRTSSRRRCWGLVLDPADRAARTRLHPSPCSAAWWRSSRRRCTRCSRCSRRSSAWTRSRHPVMAALLPLLADELRDPAARRRRCRHAARRRARRRDGASVARRPGGRGDGWLAALRDPQLGAAIAAVHRDPGHPWTLASLADRATMSRSAFAARFTAVVGTPPMAYVAASRMRAARVPARRRLDGRRCGHRARLRLRGGVQPRLHAHHRRHAGARATRGRPRDGRRSRIFHSRE